MPEEKGLRFHMIWTNLTCWPMTSPKKTPPEKTGKRPQCWKTAVVFPASEDLQMLHIEKNTHDMHFLHVFV